MRIRELAFTSGSITQEMYPEWEVMERRCLNEASKSLETAYVTCAGILGFLNKMDGGVANDDLRYYSSNSSAGS